MDWENYAPEVQARIAGLAASLDCEGLQAEFDAADANDEFQRERTGDGNADLMAYLDQRLLDIGCYD